MATPWKEYESNPRGAGVENWKKKGFTSTYYTVCILRFNKYLVK